MWLDGCGGSPVPERSATPERWIPWPQASWWSGINKATRLLTYIVGTSKTYTATIRLGESTVTDDAEGEVTATRSAASVTEEAVRAGVAALTGEIEQVPSSVSAIKVNGERAYARVRSGEEVKLAARPVTIHRFEVHGLRPVRDGEAASTWMSRWSAPRAPTSGRWPATLATRSASAAT